jgi:tetratricopeptide (TPR) repeat protein
LKRVVTHAANLLQRASLLRQTGKIKEAFAESRAAVAVVEEALVGEAANASAQHILDARMLLRDSHTAMGDYLRHLGRSADAAESYYRAITLEADVIRSASHVVVLNFPNDLYDRWLQMKRASGEEPDAEDVFSTQLATSQQLIQDPKFEQYRWSYQVRAFEFQLRLADWLVSHDRDAEAAEAYAKARTMLEPLLHKRTEVIPIGLHLGWLQQATGATVHLQRKKLNDALATHIQRGLEASRADAPVGDIHSDWNKWIELALGYYRPRQWQDAETDARKAIELARGRLEGLIRMAPLLLLAGDVDEYQALCQDLLSTSTDRHGDALTRTLQLCLLDPEPRDPELLLRTARRAAEETGDDHLLNVAYYRTGQYESAIGGLTEDLKSIANCRPLVELHLALAYHLAGYQEEARTWLAKVKSDCEPIWAVDSKVMFEVVWQQAKYMLD